MMAKAVGDDGGVDGCGEEVGAARDYLLLLADVTQDLHRARSGGDENRRSSAQPLPPLV